MQNNKNNITLSLIILILSFTNIILCFSSNFVSALSYQSEVGIGFTFNPTLSVSLSSSDLVIPNLTPGSSSDSNSINVSVATNASYGYTLSVNASSDYLTHSNNTNTFSGIATDADLASLTTDNTWGYSTSIDNSSSWSNYNGLSSSTNTTLIDNSNTADSTGNIDFKIGAKAGSTQASGIYTNTINFIAVSKVAPMSLLDSFIASGAEQYNGYFKMQDMTHDICNNVDIEESELQLIDVRDNKIYWVAKLKDGNCWMTQNLDLDLSSSVALTSETSDINPESYGKTIYTAETGYSKDETTGVVSWLPEKSTISYDELSTATWQSNGINSYDRLDTSVGTNNGKPIYPDINVMNDHGLAGNYYNWTATIASNNNKGITGDATNSICPKNWKLPSITNKEFGNLLVVYNIININTSNSYIEGVSSVNSVGKAPLYFVRGGLVASNNSLSNSGTMGFYQSNTALNTADNLLLTIRSDKIFPRSSGGKGVGLSIRCLAR